MSQKPPWMRSGYRGWDVTVDWSKVSMVRTLRALFQTRSFFTDSFVLGAFENLRPRDSVFLRVFIPEGREDEFDKLCQPYDRRTMPVVSVNDGLSSQEDDARLHGEEAPATVPGGGEGLGDRCDLCGRADSPVPMKPS